ncbi:MAG TPA: hypothetical protein VGJ05_05580 [Fimbriiglobus sp.]
MHLFATGIRRSTYATGEIMAGRTHLLVLTAVGIGAVFGYAAATGTFIPTAKAQDDQKPPAKEAPPGSPAATRTLDGHYLLFGDN